MIILPAIDIKDGKCVRLRKGEFDTAEQVAASPYDTADGFRKAGADWIHMVDLDGAKDGECTNLEIIKKIRENITIPMEIGGGIRNEKTVSLYLDEIGINRVILGTSAINNPEFLKDMIKKYGPEKIVVGVDVKDGFVSISGWLEKSEVNYLDFIKELEKIGVKYIVATDISKDGTLSRT